MCCMCILTSEARAGCDDCFAAFPITGPDSNVTGWDERVHVCSCGHVYDDRGSGVGTCGPGSMTRNVVCVDSNGYQLATTACQSPQPLSISDCDLGLCQCNIVEDCLTGLLSGVSSQGGIYADSHFECLDGACVCTSG